jgi:hypothetical protein
MKLVSGDQRITLDSRASGNVKVIVRAPAESGNYLVTADVHSQGMEFDRWVEAMVTVK